MGHNRRPEWMGAADGPTSGEARPGGALAAGLWGEAEPTRAVASPSFEGDVAPVVLEQRAGGSGRSRLRAIISTKPFRGRYARAAAASGDLRDIAWDASLRAAAIERHAHAYAGAGGDRLLLDPDALLRKVRVQKPDRLLLFVVDTSGSMGGVLTALARRIAVHALRDAYLKRAKVAMIAFRERAAQLLFDGTRKIDLVHRALDALPLGGTTPLGAGLELARRTIERRRLRARGLEPTMILISDGRANVGSRPGYERVLAEVEAAARAIARMRQVQVLFLDTTAEGKNDRHARAVNRWLAAERVALSRLSGSHNEQASALSIALH